MLMTKSVQDFITELAADSAAPGGGSAAALAGCLGAALTKMVCNLSLDEAKFGAVLPEIEAIRTESGDLLAKLTRAVDEDAAAFNEVMAAYKLPKATDEEKTARLAAIQQSMKQAALLPLGVAGDCLAVLVDGVGLLASRIAAGSAHRAVRKQCGIFPVIEKLGEDFSFVDL